MTPEPRRDLLRPVLGAGVSLLLYQVFLLFILVPIVEPLGGQMVAETVPQLLAAGVAAAIALAIFESRPLQDIGLGWQAGWLHNLLTGVGLAAASACGPARTETAEPCNTKSKRRVKCRGGKHDQHKNSAGCDNRERPVVTHHAIKPRHAERVERHTLQPSKQQSVSRSRIRDREDQNRQGNPCERRKIEYRKCQRERGAGK